MDPISGWCPPRRAMATETSRLSSVGGLEPRTSFSLSGSRAVWIVRTGALEVFAARRVKADDDAALRPLFQVNAGQAAFGILDAERLGIGLVARRSQDSEIVTSPLAI